MKKIIIIAALFISFIAEAQTTNTNELRFPFLSAADLSNRAGLRNAIAYLYMSSGKIGQFRYDDTSTAVPVRNYVLKKPNATTGRWIRSDMSNQETVSTIEDRDSIPLFLRSLHLRVKCLENPDSTFELQNCLDNSCWIADTWISDCYFRGFVEGLPNDYFALNLNNTIAGSNDYNAPQNFKDSIIATKGLYATSGSLTLKTGDVQILRSGAKLNLVGKTTGSFTLSTGGTDTGRIYSNGIPVWLSTSSTTNPLQNLVFDPAHNSGYYYYRWGASTTYDKPVGESDTLAKQTSGSQTARTHNTVQNNGGTVLGIGDYYNWVNTGNTSTTRPYQAAWALNNTIKTIIYPAGAIATDTVRINQALPLHDSTDKVFSSAGVMREVAAVKALIPTSGITNSYEGKANFTTFTPTSGTTYVIGDNTTPAGSGGTNNKKIYLAKSGAIKKVSFFAHIAGTVATNETASLYVSINGGSDQLLISGITLTATTQQFKNVALNLSIPTGDYTDYMEFKIVMPTFTTAPTNVSLTVRYYIETN